MTGTSIDALDCALVRIEGHGLDLRAQFVRAVTRPLADLAPRLRAVAEQAPTTAGALAALSRDFALLHVAAIRELLEAAGVQRADLLSIHGQTVYHAPPTSWQLLNPHPIAQALKTPVVFDLRGADLAAGGQGAPVTPLSDWVLFRSASEFRAVVNLGGFCNITLLPPATPPEPDSPESVRGRDLSACNHVLDTIARRVMGVPYDDGGKQALAAEVDSEALDDLLGVLVAQSGAKRSLGTGDDDLMSWIGRHRARLSGGTLAATACEAIGQIIAKDALGCDRVLLAGGGVRNAALVRAITSCCSCRVETSAAHAVPPEYREAIGMAILGSLCQDRVPMTLSAVTHVTTPPLSGSWVHP